jgi:anti-anti-sigma factor
MFTDWNSDFSTHFRMRHKGQIAIVELIGPEIRQPEPAIELGGDLVRLLEEDRPKGVLVEMGRVRYLCSSAFAVLIEGCRKAAAIGIPFKLSGIHPDVEVGAKILGLGRLIETYEDERAALASF